MNKISSLKSPALAGVIKEKSERDAIAEIKNCLYHGADMIDLHMSCLEKTDVETLSNIISASRLPVLALNYNVDYDMNACGLSEEERVQTFRNAVAAGAAGVDIQGYTFNAEAKTAFCGEDKYSFTKCAPLEVVTDAETISKQCEFIEWVHSNNAEVLLSCHPNRVMSCQQIVDLALFLEQRHPDIIKIVSLAETQDDLVESFVTMKELKKNLQTKVSFHVGGKCGALSRIINPMLGSHIVFCNDSFKGNSIMEQVHLETARRIIDSVERIESI